MSEVHRAYLPAAGRHWALPLYDPIVKLLGGETARKELLDQADLRAGLRILDIGCGTGTLAVMLKRHYPDVTLVGLDPDPKALARAQRKAQREKISVQFDQGFSDQLPYPDASFDRVLSSFMYHHLGPEEKAKTLREVRRVLRPGGSFHLVDFAGPESGRKGFLARLLHTRDRLRDNSSSRILSLLQRTGFPDPQKVAQRSMLFSHIAYYQALASA